MKGSVFIAPKPRAAAPVVPLGEKQIRQAIARLQALPAFFPAVQKALALLEDPGSHNDHIQRVICSDPAVSARVLRLANSAYFGFYSEVSTITLAITLMGRERVSTLLQRYLAEELIQMLSGRKPAAEHIREMSVVTATAAHALAERLLRKDKEEVLLAGLLHNIGELVLLSQFRDRYEEMLRLADRVPREQAEQRVLGVRSQIIGKWLLEAWNFPELFPTVIEHYADPWAVPFTAAPAPVTIIVHLARKLAKALIEDAGDGRANPSDGEAVAASLSPRALSALEVTPEFLADVYQKLPEEIQRAKSVLA